MSPRTLYQGTTQPELNDRGYVVCVNAINHNLHLGYNWFIKDYIDFGAEDTEAEFVFTTGSPLRIHAKALLYSNVEFVAEIYEDVTVTIDATSSEIASFNNDRDSIEVPQLQAYANVTVNDEGTCIWRTKFGDKKEAGVTSQFSYEIVAKSNSTYLWKLTKIDVGVGYVDYDFYWCQY